MSSYVGACRRLELFLGCRSLTDCKENSTASFAVLFLRTDEYADFKEIARTETVCNTVSPQFCTSSEIDFLERSIEHAAIRVDIYRRKTEQSEKLRDHVLLGKVYIPIDTILTSQGNHVTTQLSHPVESKKIGVLTISAEEVDTSNPENDSEIQLDISAAVLRKRDWNRSILGQRYELSRAHKHDDTDGHTVWLPTYRSNRISKQRDSNAVLEFSSATLKHRHLCNGDDERRMRLAVYAAPCLGIKKAMSEIFIGMVEFTLRDLCEIDPTKEVLQIDRETAELQDLGNMAIVHAQPTDFGSYFSLRLDYKNTGKYTSAGCPEKNMSKVKAKAIAKRLSIHHRDKFQPSRHLKKESSVSPASALFANTFSE